MARERWSSRWAAGYGFRFFASPHREFVLEEVREYSDTTLNEVFFFGVLVEHGLEGKEWGAECIITIVVYTTVFADVLDRYLN